MFKVNPPLRTDADVAAVKAGLADGAIDAIATDHAPHAQEAKEQPFDQAPPGMLGLETALALALTELDLPVEPVLALLSWQPAGIAGLAAEHGGPIAEAGPPTSASSTPAPRGPSTRPGWRPAAATRPTPAARSTAGSATRPAGRARRARRRGPAMTPIERSCDARPLLVLADGDDCSRARPSAPSRRAVSRRARSCSTPCCPATRR